MSVAVYLTALYPSSLQRRRKYEIVLDKQHRYAMYHSSILCHYYFYLTPIGVDPIMSSYITSRSLIPQIPAPQTIICHLILIPSLHLTNPTNSRRFFNVLAICMVSFIVGQDVCESTEIRYIQESEFYMI